MLKNCANIWDQVRETTPLIHCITNYVTVNDVANIILASGASPAMVENPEESRDFARLAGALYLNLGTLTGEQEQAMLEAMIGAATANVPVVIDPVACGVIPRKIKVVKKLAAKGNITCIKGNIAEMKSLAGLVGEARGVDSLDQGEGLEAACKNLALINKQVLAATGAVDLVTDGQGLAVVSNGTPLFGTITGAGCMVGGVMAACIAAVSGEPWLAATTGLLAFNIAGERAAAASGDNPGTFRSLLFNHLYHLKGNDILREARVEFRI